MDEDEYTCDICSRSIYANDEFEGRPCCDFCAESLQEKRDKALELINGMIDADR